MALNWSKLAGWWPRAASGAGLQEVASGAIAAAPGRTSERWQCLGVIAVIIAETIVRGQAGSPRRDSFETGVGVLPM
jgi:hypothetical protein